MESLSLLLKQDPKLASIDLEFKFLFISYK
jgi:hypothetical protein